MKACVFADIHGNDDAFCKMLKKEQYDMDIFIFLGDIFGYFYGQRKIINLLKSLNNAYAVLGNHDEAYLKSLRDYNYREYLLRKYGKSYEIELSEEERRYIEELPKRINLKVDGKSIVGFHGGPNDYTNQRIYPNTEINFQVEADFLLLGHTHYQLIKKLERTTVINPGSLGQPRDGKGFSYCVIDTNTGNVNFKIVKPNTEMLLLQVENAENQSDNYYYLSKKYGEFL